MNNKKNYGDLGGCYPPRPKDSKDNTLLDLDTIILHKILIIIHLLIVTTSKYISLLPDLKKRPVLTRGFLM